MFEGFETKRIEVDGVGINLRQGGSGPPLLLLHGYPQTHVAWHKVAPRLAECFTVVCPDLRGYGDSDKPPSLDTDFSTYCKRTTAHDQVAVMRDIGFERFHLVGHDRGVRVGLRMALDHPEAIQSSTNLDVVPSQVAFEAMDSSLSYAWFHWHLVRQLAAISGNPNRRQPQVLPRLPA
jgi:haloacetate dehalogenase